MRTKALWIATVFAITVFTAQFSWAGTQLWDFEKGDDGWEVANGKWSVKGGVYQETSGVEAAMHTLVGEEDWDNYTVEAKIRLDEGDWAGLIFRAQSELEYYVYYLNVPNNKSELWRHKEGAFDARDPITSNMPAVGVEIKNDEWFDVKIIVDGPVFEFFINDEFQDEQEDKAYDTGKIGVFAWQTQASFDDVTITGDNVIDTLAVDARSKLATTWSRIKKRRHN